MKIFDLEQFFYIHSNITNIPKLQSDKLRNFDHPTLRNNASKAIGFYII
jgi:hypothetical protein